jgi:hypothetical protein
MTDDRGGSDRLEEAQREENATDTFRESVSHGKEAAGPKPEPLKEGCRSAHARASEPTKQLLRTVDGHQQPEHQPRNQQTRIHGVFPPLTSDQHRSQHQRTLEVLPAASCVRPLPRQPCAKYRPAAADARA